MSTQEMEVASTHCSATFGSRESDSAGVPGEEEPDSCIWHSSSSVMMSNTASSGSLESVFAPGAEADQETREAQRLHTGWGGSLREQTEGSYTGQAGAHCECPLQMGKRWLLDTLEKQS